MSGAIWSAARNQSLSWRRFWPQWKKKHASLPVRGVLEDSRLVLVGYYSEPEGLNRAAAEFAVASFTEEDAVFVRSHDAAQRRWWLRVCAWVHTCWIPSSRKRDLSPIAGTEELLAAGGGLVLVRCPARFHTACEIIERTGGQVGVARRAAA